MFGGTARLLDIYLAEHARARFAWRTNNCCHFAGRWLTLATGERPMTGMRETTSLRDARRLVGTLGGTLADACTRRLGREPIAPARARLGDIVLVQVGADGAAVGICNGRVAAFLTQDEGLTFLPMGRVTHAWRLRAEEGAQ